MFPLTFKYSSEIEDLDLSKPQIIKRVKQAVDEKRAAVVFISDDELIYSGTTVRFPWRGNFAQSVDKGRFRLLQENSNTFLEYEIYIHTGVYFSVGFSILAGFASLNIWIGLFFLLMFGGGGVAPTYLRHKTFFHYVVNRLKPGAEDLDHLESPRVLTKEDKKEMGVGILIVLIVMTLIILLIIFLPL